MRGLGFIVGRSRSNDYMRRISVDMLSGGSICRFNVFPLVQASQSIQDYTNDKEDEQGSKNGKLNSRAQVHDGIGRLKWLKFV